MLGFSQGAGMVTRVLHHIHTCIHLQETNVDELRFELALEMKLKLKFVVLIGGFPPLELVDHVRYAIIN